MILPDNNKKKSILYISYDGILEPLGRSQILAYLKDLSNEYRIHLISFEKRKDLHNLSKKSLLDKEIEEAEINWKGLTYHKGRYFFGTFYDLFIGFLVSTFLMLICKIKIVHIRGYLPGLIIWPLKYSFNFKLLFDMRGFWPDEKADRAGWSRDGKTYKFFKAFEKKLLKSSDTVVALTNESLEIISAERPEFSSSEVIRTCVDRSIFKHNNKRNKRKGFNLCHLGSVDTAYDLEPILDFVKSIDEEEGLKIHFLNRDKREFIKAKCKEKGLDEESYSVSYAEPNEISQFLSGIDLGCFYAKENFSIKASMPTKIGEFLSCGIPILCNPFNLDIIDIINEYQVGFLHNFKDSESNKYKFEEIKSFYTDDSLRERCLDLSEKVFSLERGVESYRSIYKKLLERTN